MKTKLDSEVANWVQLAQYTPHVRAVVNTVMEKRRISLPGKWL